MRTIGEHVVLRGAAAVRRSSALACLVALVTAIPALAQPAARGDAQLSPESSYRQRTESFEEKIALLEAAWQKNDYRLARALAHSLRNTVIQAEQEGESPGKPLLPAARFQTIESLPAAWRAWAEGWKYAKAVHLDETAGLARPPEPVEVLVACPAGQAASLAREVRVAEVTGEGTLREIPSQTYAEVRRGAERLAKVLFEQTWEPGWSSNRLTDEGRRRLGLDK